MGMEFEVSEKEKKKNVADVVGREETKDNGTVVTEEDDGHTSIIKEEENGTGMVNTTDTTITTNDIKIKMETQAESNVDDTNMNNNTNAIKNDDLENNNNNNNDDHIGTRIR